MGTWVRNDTQWEFRSFHASIFLKGNGLRYELRKGWQRMRWLDSITEFMDMNLSKLQEIAKDREAWHAALHGVTRSGTGLNDWTMSCEIKKSLSKNIYFQKTYPSSDGYFISKAFLYLLSYWVLQKTLKDIVPTIYNMWQRWASVLGSRWLDVIKAACQPSRHLNPGLLSCAGAWWRRKEEEADGSGGGV